VSGVKYVIAADNELGRRGFVSPDAVALAQVSPFFEETQDEDGVFMAKARRENRAVADIKGFHGGGYVSFVAAYASIFLKNVLTAAPSC
jgi:hypothetical protein